MKSVARLCILGATLALMLSSAASAEYLVPGTNIRFPDRLGAMTLWRGQPYPDARLGHGIEYRTQITTGMLAGSVYVYDGGRTDIPDGIKNPIVRVEFEQARSDVLTLARQQGLPTPNLMSERIVRAGTAEFLVATYKMVRNNVSVLSLVGMTGARRHFIKLRISVPDASGPLGTAVMDKFVEDVGRLFQTGAGTTELISPTAARLEIRPAVQMQSH